MKKRRDPLSDGGFKFLKKILMSLSGRSRNYIMLLKGRGRGSTRIFLTFHIRKTGKMIEEKPFKGGGGCLKIGKTRKRSHTEQTDAKKLVLIIFNYMQGLPN